MADQSEKTMEQTGSIIKEFFRLLAERLKALAEKAEFSQQTAAMRELAKLCESGQGLTEYTVKGVNRGQLVAKLKEQGFAAVEMSDTPDKMLIRTVDRDSIYDLNVELNLAKGNYYNEVSVKHFETAIAEADSKMVKDKRVIEISGLDRYQMEVLKNKCNDITRGFTVGTDEALDGTGRIVIRAQNAFAQDLKEKHTDFAKAYLKSVISLYGPNMIEKMTEIDADKEIDDKVAELKNDPNSYYLVSVDDKTKYIELGNTDFQYYKINKDGKEQIQAQVEKSNPNYEYELQRCMDEIKNRAIIGSREELDKHLSTKERTIDTIRPERNQEAINKAAANDILAAKIDEMVRPLAEEVAEKEGSYEAFRSYEQYSADVLDQAINNHDHGFREEDIVQIKEELDKRGAYIFDYAECERRLRDVQTIEREAQRYKKKEVNKAREDFTVTNNVTKGDRNDSERN